MQIFVELEYYKPLEGYYDLEVKLNTLKTLLFYISFRGKNVFEFRDISNVDEVLCSYSVAPIVIGVLCMGQSTNTLQFTDGSKNMLEVRRLDCSKSVPILCDDLTKTRRAKKNLYYILVARHAGMTLLFVAGHTFLDAYKPNSSEVTWNNEHVSNMERDLDPYSLSTDGDGHLFVMDLNNDCVHMFSLDDGSHMGVVLSEEEGLSCFHDISWCNKKASLAVLCRENGKACIAFYKIENDDN